MRWLGLFACAKQVLPKSWERELFTARSRGRMISYRNSKPDRPLEVYRIYSFVRTRAANHNKRNPSSKQRPLIKATLSDQVQSITGDWRPISLKWDSSLMIACTLLFYILLCWPILRYWNL